MANYHARLSSGQGNFNKMMENGFAVVTVMNARVYKFPGAAALKNKTAYDVVSSYKDEKGPGYLCTLDTLKIANVTMEGPTKTITGGRNASPLLKYGKTARLEMQDALGSASAIDALCGGILERSGNNAGPITSLHFGEDFSGAKLIVGESFFIDKESGEQVPVNVVFYQFLPDNLFNLTQDAEGDASVFDMNGDLIVTDIQVGTESNSTSAHGVFYSIVNPAEAGDSSAYQITNTGGNVSLTGNPSGTSVKYSKDAGETWQTECTGATPGQTVYIRIINNEKKEVVDSLRVIAAA